MTLRTITTNLETHQLRRESMEGRTYAVAPVVAVVAGVLNGELLPTEELARFAEAWNGEPVPLRHPQNEAGQHVSANSPAVIEADVVGRLFNVTADGNKLKGELWLDEEKMRAMGGEAETTLARLDAGEILEVSTAYLCDVEPASGLFEGQAYNGIQRNLRPDHVALLPDEVGACSIADGCGAGRANRRTDAQARRSVMVAFYLRIEDASALALEGDKLPDGAEVLPASQLHVTLAHLGELAAVEAETQFSQVANALAEFAAWETLVLATVNGVGRFHHGGEQDALFLHLESQPLHQLRTWLCEFLRAEVPLEIGHNNDFIPHVTLAYVPAEAAVTLPPPERRTLVLDRLALSWGAQTIEFELRGRPRNRERTVAGNTQAIEKPEEESMSEHENELETETDPVTVYQAPGDEAEQNPEPIANEENIEDASSPAEDLPETTETPAALELPAELSELADGIRAFGGVQPFLDAVSAMRANANEQREERVARLTANARCAFDRSDLQAMSLEQLGKLERSLLPADYSGQAGVGLTPVEELRVYKGSRNGTGDE